MHVRLLAANRSQQSARVWARARERERAGEAVGILCGGVVGSFTNGEENPLLFVCVPLKPSKLCMCPDTHSRAARCTKAAGVIPSAPCPLW